MKTDFPLAQLYVTKDLSSVVQIVLEHPDDFVGRELRVAPTEQSMHEAAATIEKVTGRKAAAYDAPIPTDIPAVCERGVVFSC